MNIVRILDECLRRLGRNGEPATQGELASRLGVSQPTVSRWYKGGDLKLKHRDKLLSLAAELGVMDGQVPFRSGVPIVGYVGAGGEILFNEGQGPFGEAPMPKPALTKGEISPSLVAVELRGDSWSGLMEDGSLLYFDDRREPPTDDLMNRLCVVGLPDGRILVKRLMSGTRRGLFTLYSSNAPPTVDVEVIWAARVAWIEPR